MQWEYKEEMVNFGAINVKGRGRLSSLKFSHARDNHNQMRQAKIEAWETILPILQERLNEIGKEGWQLTVPLDMGLLSYETGDSEAL